MPWVLYGDFNSIFAPSDKLMGDFNLEDVRLAQGLVEISILWRHCVLVNNLLGLMVKRIQSGSN